MGILFQDIPRLNMPGNLKLSLVEMGVPLTDMKVIYKPYDIIPHTYANVAKEFSKIFGYKMN